jgi:hypothetical protein
LTGERVRRRFVVKVRGKPVALTYVCFSTLLALIVSRAGPDSGYVAASHVTIARLRRAIDSAGRDGAGMELIETGVEQEYRLKMAPNRLRASLALEKTFFELEPLNVVTAEQANALRRLCRVVNSA